MPQQSIRKIIFSKIRVLPRDIWNEMKNASKMQNIRSYTGIIIVISAVLIGLIYLNLTYPASAQNVDSPWTDPVNLSQSGENSEPRLVVDSEGRIHVYWLNDFDGLMYTYRDQAGNWTDPVTALAPFEFDLSTVQFLPDPRGFIHAFWLEGNSFLYYSRTTNIGNTMTWGIADYIADGVIGFQASLNGTAGIHLGYMTYQDAPTAIYYRGMDESGIWSTPELVYQSPYFRNLIAEDAHLRIDSGSAGLVLMAWDDRYMERVYAAWSADTGETWSEPNIVDQRYQEDSLDSSGPSEAMVHITQENAILMWQAGHEGEFCTQYYALIPNDFFEFTAEGETAPALDLQRQVLSPFSQDCPGDLTIIEPPDSTLWLLSRSNNGLQLGTWSGSEWSLFQSQDELIGFVHPDTYRRLDLDCNQVASFQDKLIFIGCDTGITRDIWFSDRTLGDSSTWFPTPTPAPLWSTLSTVTEEEQNISTPVLFSSPTNRIHAIWGGAEGKIYHAVQEDQRWTQPVAILTSPGEQVEQLSAAIDQDGYIFTAWDVPGSEAIYYSWVQEAVANIADMWQIPQALPVPGIVRSPQVVFDLEGRILISYVVPLNEGRGAYLIHSTEPIQEDNALQWSSPGTVFDAQAEGWSMVDQVRFNLGLNNTKNILMTRYDPPPAGVATGLYFTRSSNDSWSEPFELYTDGIGWSQILTSPDGTIHAAWQVKGDDGQSTLWHAYSTDQGVNWVDPIRISGFTSRESPASLIIDQAGGLQLVQINQSGFITLDGTRPLTLQNWVFNGSEWNLDEQLSLDNITDPLAIAADITLNGDLATLILARSIPENEPDEALNVLVFSQRPIDISESIPMTVPTFTPVPTQVQAEPTPLPTPTPLLEFSTESETRLPALLNNRWAGILLGGIPAVLIVSLALMAILRRTRK